MVFGAGRRESVVGDPLAYGLMVEFEREVRFAGPVVEVLDGDVVSAGGFVERGGKGATCGLVAAYGFAVRGSLPGFDIDGGVAFGGHVLGFDAVGVVAYAALLVGDAGFFLEPFGDGVAPDDGVAGLIGEEFEGFVEAVVVDEGVECLPARGVGLRGGGAFVVGVVDVLDYGFAFGVFPSWRTCV